MRISSSDLCGSHTESLVLRHPPDPGHPGPGPAQPRGAIQRGDRARLVKHTEWPEGVQRPSRPARRGRGAVVVIFPGGRRGACVGREMERLRRLAYGSDRGSTPMSAQRRVAALPSATRWSAATASRRSTRSPTRSARPAAGDLGASRSRSRGAELEEEPWPSATPVRGRFGRHATATASQMSEGDELAEDLHLPQLEPVPSGAPKSPRGAQRVDRVLRSASAWQARHQLEIHRWPMRHTRPPCAPHGKMVVQPDHGVRWGGGALRAAPSPN